MKIREAMSALKAMGTAQNVKVYKRHGAGDKLFGVSFANLNKLKKQIKVDHPLAEALWKTGNADARSLATMIADPDAFTAASADAWVKDIEYYLLSDLLAGVVARSKLALSKIRKWTKAKNEFVRQCGYSLMSATLRDAPDQVPETFLDDSIVRIEKEIHASPNRARHAMNMALVAIGLAHPKLEKTVYAAAKRIGKVEVDHGETSCQTPDVKAYIEKAKASKAKMKAKRAAKKKVAKKKVARKKTAKKRRAR